MDRYLLIADGASFQTTRIKSYFASRGYRVETVESALDCIESMQREPPDVLILDCGLLWGGCDGVLAWLQETTARSHVPVVLTTEQSCQQNTHQSVVKQMRRPFDVEALFKAVNSAFPQTQREIENEVRQNEHFVPAVIENQS